MNLRTLQPLNWIQWFTLGLAAVTVVAFVVVFLRIENVQRHQNDALRSIICRAEHVVETQPGIPEKKRQEALRFYRNALRGAHLKPCEEK